VFVGSLLKSDWGAGFNSLNLRWKEYPSNYTPDAYYGKQESKDTNIQVENDRGDHQISILAQHDVTVASPVNEEATVRASG